MKNSAAILVLYCALVFLGCKGKNHNPVSVRTTVPDQAAFTEWVDEHKPELVNSRKIDDLDVKLMYLPQAGSSETEFSFLLNISSIKQENLMARHNSHYATIEEKMMYWSSGIRKRLFLLTDKDTIPCAVVIYENMGNIRNDINVNVGFSGKSGGYKKFTVIYDDDYFGLGRLNFTFDHIINTIPLIETSK